MSLRRRLALLSAVAVALTVLLASGLIYALVRDRLRDEIDDELQREAARASSRVEPLVPMVVASSPGEVTVAPAPGPPPGAAAPGGAPPGFGPGRAGREPPGDPLVLPAPEPGRAPAVAQIIGADGAVITEPGGFEIPVSGEDLSVAEGGEAPRLADVESEEGDLRVLTQPLDDGAALQVARSLEETNRTLSTLIVILAVVSAGGVALAAALGPAVARTALAPARDVSGTAEEVARTHDLTRRIEVRGGDELGRLAASFNEMMEALEQSESAQRRLVADASHELRTPLATLRTNIETLGQQERLDPAERDRLVADVTGELEELTELVADLVELARLPGSDGAREHEDLALDELARDAVERAERRARGLRFELRISPTVVCGDRQRLGRAISNMLDNASKWSPQGGAIEVEVTSGRVAVRDHGPGFAAEDLPKVFGRFWRSDDARGKPGSGLGLAIVQRVAEEHGGVARARNADGGGAAVSIELPQRPAESEASS